MSAVTETLGAVTNESQEHVGQTDQVIQWIKQIASQTNLLGDVAEEIQKLAANSVESFKKVKGCSGLSY